MARPIISAQNVPDFGDLMIPGMEFPDLSGVALLSGKVRVDLPDYREIYERGEFKVYEVTARNRE